MARGKTTSPSPDELVAAHPQAWEQAQRDVAAVLARDDADEIRQFITRVSQPQASPSGRARSRADRLHQEIRRQLIVHLLKQAILSSSTGVTSGRVRFNLLAGAIAQRLLFRRRLERKPVPLRAFRLIWPLLRGQRRLLMPLVQPQGIWCFYSRPLIAELARLIGDRPCLEIAAGDGTLTRFLDDEGAHVTATDDYSWSGSASFPATVLQQDARTALRHHKPQVVLCSWPPAGNPFEQYVFSTPSVQDYLVIGSPHETSTGNRGAYRSQTTFRLTERPDLSRLLLPPEINHAVLHFTRDT
jgi:hypothetical protein